MAELQGCSAEDVYLFPSGMAAVFTAYRLFQRLRPEQRSIQFGFPYVDNLKIQQRLSRIQAAENAVAFFPRGTESDIDEVARLAATESLLGLFVELPGNPLLGSPNIARLSELSLRQDFPLLIDDTFAACVNLDTLPAADAVATSLTKYFSGAGNVLAGSLVLNRERPYYERLKTLLAEEFEDIFYGEDAIVLERNSRDVAQRIPRINANAARLCEFLAERPEVADVFYPGACRSCELRTAPSSGRRIRRTVLGRVARRGREDRAVLRCAANSQRSEFGDQLHALLPVHDPSSLPRVGLRRKLRHLAASDPRLGWPGGLGLADRAVRGGPAGMLVSGTIFYVTLNHESVFHFKLCDHPRNLRFQKRNADYAEIRRVTFDDEVCHANSNVHRSTSFSAIHRSQLGFDGGWVRC